MKRRFLSLVFAAILLLCMSFGVFADVFDSFSDGDNGWDSDYDFGDYDYDYDYDYGGSFSPLSIDLFGDAATVIIVGIIVLIIIINSNGKKTYSGPWSESPASAEKNTLGEEEIIERIKATDPAFSDGKFKTFVKSALVEVQEAWESHDIFAVSPVTSENLSRMLQTYVDDYVKKGYTNHLDFQNVRSVTMTDYVDDGSTEAVTIKAEVSLVDYVTDASGKVVRGNPEERHRRTYKLEFIRRSGTVTQEDDGTVAKTCPSCGAPVTVNNTGRCSYCHSVIISSEYGWVMNQYGEWKF